MSDEGGNYDSSVVLSSREATRTSAIAPLATVIWVLARGKSVVGRGSSTSATVRRSSGRKPW